MYERTNRWTKDNFEFLLDFFEGKEGLKKNKRAR